jgi:hypothetical protein
MTRASMSKKSRLKDSNDMTEHMVPASIDPCLEKREPDEPMFILLARDSSAPETMEFWCREREAEIRLALRDDTQQEREHIEQVRAKVGACRVWRKINRPIREADGAASPDRLTAPQPKTGTDLSDLARRPGEQTGAGDRANIEGSEKHDH